MPNPLRKRIYRIWIGPLPAWTPQFVAHVERLKEFGWEFVIKNDPEEIEARFEKNLGVKIKCQPGTRKAGDYDPFIGDLFPDELKGIDFWGHCALDAVFGRLERFLPDAFLSNVDVFGNDPDAICGPFSLYRNCLVVNELYHAIPSWRVLLQHNQMQAIDEIHLTQAVRLARLRGQLDFWSTFQQGHDKQPWHMPVPKLRSQNGVLLDFPNDRGREIMMFHFNRKDKTPQWPLS